MTLTTEDIQLIKHALKPEFDKIDGRFEHVDKQLSNFKSEVHQGFKQVDKQFD